MKDRRMKQKRQTRWTRKTGVIKDGRLMGEREREREEERLEKYQREDEEKNQNSSR